jgi:protein tyrosine phosphatase (PTP) superfamily phosphohydrolase (DUF442 family)
MSSQGLERIYNYLCLSDHVGTAGQPTEEQFGDIRAAGYEVVVNLDVLDTSQRVWDEAEVIARHGMNYIHIPVLWESPQPEDLDQFLRTMDSLQGKKVFVHCAANARVSAFMLLYRVIRQGVPMEAARQSLRRIWEPNDVWRRFIDDSLARYGIADSLT